MDINQKALEIINQATAAMPGSGIQFCAFKDGKCVVVSKGLGAHTLKIRFLNPAEVIVLHLNGR